MDFTSSTTESEQWLQESTGSSLPLGDGGMSEYASDSSMVWANEADASSASASVTSRDHRIVLNSHAGEQLRSNVPSGSYSPFKNSQMATRPFLSTTPLEPIETSGHDMQSEDTDFLSPVSAENEGVSTGHVAPKTDAEIRAEKRKMKRFRLTPNQTRFLMSEYARQAHPDAAQRERLSREIPGLSPRQVQVWFQNRYARARSENESNMADKQQQKGEAQAINSRRSGEHAQIPSTASRLRYDSTFASCLRCSVDARFRQAFLVLPPNNTIRV
ncbi:MAG: hypothetical protein Q9173_004761 [Seirophora scorigena]